MNSETYIDFCFVRKATGHFESVIDELLVELFKGLRLNWYLEEKTEDGAEIVIAEIKGMSKWESEKEALQFIEDYAGEAFWDYIQGYKMFIYPAKKGCHSCAIS